MQHQVFLADISRQLQLTLTAIWGREFPILPLPDNSTRLPKVQQHSLLLPDSLVSDSYEAAYRTYLATALHAAAHQVYSHPTESENLNNRQLALIGLIEDARIEKLAEQHFPGISKLFAPQFASPLSQHSYFDEISFEIAKGLHTGQPTENPLVAKAVSLFEKHLADNLKNRQATKTIGLALANDIGQMRISMNERSPFSILAYRDDNAFLWQQTDAVARPSESESDTESRPEPTSLSFEETLNGRSVSHEQQKEIQADLTFQYNRDASGPSLNTPATAGHYCYPEWDYRIGLTKKDWCRLNEFQPESVEDISSDRSDKYTHLIEKIHRIVSQFQFDHERKKKQEDGQEIDLDALVDYSIQRKSGHADSENKIYIQHAKHRGREFSLLILLDLSQSMNNLIDQSDSTILEVTLDATAMLSQLIDKLGHSHAIHGFNSNGRNEVNYQILKAFDPAVTFSTAQLYHAQAGLSTRLGTALRHAYQKISTQKTSHKLILVITDGHPSDIDVYDPNYLTEDAASAVKEIESSGCKVFCLSLDSKADQYIHKIFRPAHYEIVDTIEKLPNVLTKLYLTLFKSFLN